MEAYSTNIDALIAVKYKKTEKCYIAQVINEDPIQLKFEEKGDFSKVDILDCEVLDIITHSIQIKPHLLKPILRHAAQRNEPFFSGLRAVSNSERCEELIFEEVA